MWKPTVLTLLLAAGISQACSFLWSEVRFDTLSPGVVRAVQSTETTDIRTMQPVWRHDTLGVYRQSDFRASLQADLRDSALVFIGRVDTIVYDTGFTPTPLIELGPSDAFSSWPFHARLTIDSLLKGTLPAKTFWVKAHLPTHSCAFSWRTKRAFLNVSNKLELTSDIKQPTTDPGPRGHYIATAQWFDGRYIVSPKFPGLRLDITELYPDYPATNVTPRRLPPAPLRPDGKLYRPDGRSVGPDAASKSPVPLLR